MNRKNTFLLLLAVSCIISGITAAIITTTIITSKNKGENNQLSSFSNNDTPSVHLTSGQRDFSSAVDFTVAAEESIHAVVHVKTVSYVQSRYMADPFEFFFGTPFFNSQPQQQIGMGSGVIISSNGYIITNNHVIEGASNIEVTMNDKQTFQAKIIGADPATDIALLKIEAENLSFLRFGNSDELKVGEWVLAVGNPFNLTSTVTAGIVSAKGRSLGIISGSMGIESFIQTDAAVNAGNSGGALVNTAGELVGINTAIASPTGNFSGYSFAVPAAIAKKAVDDLTQYGVVQRALLVGVRMEDLNAETVQKYNLTVKNYQGVLVTAISEKSAAHAAGLKPGDVIVKINNVSVNLLSSLQEQIGRYRPNDQIVFTVLRDEKEKQIPIVLNNKNGGTELVSSGDELISSLGATFKVLDNKEKAALGVNYGIQITDIGKGKFQDAGIRKTYIILRVNKTPISSVENLQTVLKQSEGAILVEGLYPNGRRVYYGVEI